MASTAPAASASSTRRGVVGFLVVMEFGSGMLQGWYPVLLTGIGTEFSVSAAQLNWVNVIYLLTTVLFVPIVAKLGDRYGHKRMLTIAASVVAAGCIIVALAPDFTWLLVGRALQGALASFLPLEFAIVRDRDEKRAGRSIGKLIGALTFGGAVGSLSAGILYSVIGSLRPVLWVPAVFLTLCVPVVAFLVPESKSRAHGRIDWLGAGLLGVGLLIALVGISNAATWGWGNPITWAAILGGIALLFIWLQVERRVKAPLIDIGFLRHGGVGLPLVMAVLLGAQLFGSQTASMLYLLTDPAVAGFGLGVPAGAVGVIALVAALSMFVASVLSDRIVRRIGIRATLLVGGSLTTLGFLVLIFAAASFPAVLVSLVVSGLGNGLLISVLATLIVNRAPADSVGIASAMYNTSRTVAGAVAGAVFALVMASFVVTIGTGEAQTTVTSFTGYLVVWIICAAATLALVVVAWLFTSSPAPTETIRTTTTEPTTSDIELRETR
ncbi:MFS transporter [Subtercola endophyticus]|uniref:MFS transporter n=1 Tax=Subtercola endophyticus TaxID=2895559 RepID=UPI001E61211B|nr:MFS transporter [Subtercola endophyticus]UFS60174.1 MFS transporter [Subtercola endophyticus]